MKKIITSLTILIFIFVISLILILSTIGFETNKFNKLISNKVYQKNNINLDLDTIKFKIDLKELSLFLETQNPTVSFKEIFIPVQNLKVYIDFLSLRKSKPEISKISIDLEEIDIIQLNQLSKFIKPSNLKSFLNNKIKKGKLISEIDFFFSDQGELKNFIAKGLVKDIEAKINDQLSFTDTKLSFFADKSDILIKNIFGTLGDVKIFDGDIKINLENGIKLVSNFNSKLNLDEKFSSKYSKLLNRFDILKSIKNLSANFNNNISIDLDNTYKIKNYNYNISGKIEKSKFELAKQFKNKLITDKFKTIYFSDLQFKSLFSPQNIYFNGTGKYSLNNLDFLKVNLSNNFDKNFANFKLNFDYKDDFELNLINYKKPSNSIANVFLDFEKRKDEIKINQINFKEANYLIKINGIKIKKNDFISFEDAKIVTPNNNFIIYSKKKIIVKGEKFDATNLAKFFKEQNNENKYQELNSNIEIEFKNMKLPMSEVIQNFRLIGEIKKGKFVKISSKGDFGGGNYLDISMKKDKESNKKYLEIYSDLPRPLLAEYSFFSGLSGGQLLFTSIIENSKSNSKLKVENFRVINAPGVIKLLSLADLGGLADIVKGDGLSFDILEINMEKNDNFLKLNEILALGPSMSVLMEGYQDKNGLTSLRGTLVPAKTLNRMISRIPIIGNIVIPKEVGEGLFGVSFKMKGPEGNIKTTINPIKTLTPRFIQKIIERNRIK